MPSALFRRVNLDYLYGPFLEKALDVIADCQAAGREYWASLGFRTWAEQDDLYAKGRALPGHIVTEAKGGDSAHNYGLAIDFVAQKAGIPTAQVFLPDWGPACYDLLGHTALLRGLVWGGSWTAFPDRPHIQWPGFVTATDLAPLRVAYESTNGATLDKLRAVWAIVDRM